MVFTWDVITSLIQPAPDIYDYLESHQRYHSRVVLFNIVRCNFDSGALCSFTNSRSDVFDWTIHNGSTPSTGTGPSRDASPLGLLAGNYVYIEASNPRKLHEYADLVSPKIRGAQCLKFSYHMFGDHIGSLRVYQDKGFHWTTLFLKSGNQGNQWKKSEVQIYNGNGKVYSVSTVCIYHIYRL